MGARRIAGVRGRVGGIGAHGRWRGIAARSRRPGGWYGRGVAGAVLVLEAERAQLRQKHLELGLLLLRVVLKDRPLVILHLVWLAVQFAYFGELLGDRVALLRKRTV